MSRDGHIVVLVTLGVCTIILTYFSVLVINTLEPASQMLAWIIVIATVSSACILQFLVIVWTIAELSDRLHFYKLEQKRRQIEFQIHRRQPRFPTQLYSSPSF